MSNEINDKEPLIAVPGVSAPATSEQVINWKSKHGEVFEVTVDGKYCYLHKPSRKTMSYALTKSQTDPMGFIEVIVENCWITGDLAFKDDDTYFFALSNKVNELMHVKEAELKKL